MGSDESYEQRKFARAGPLEPSGKPARNILDLEASPRMHPADRSTPVGPLTAAPAAEEEATEAGRGEEAWKGDSVTYRIDCV